MSEVHGRLTVILVDATDISTYCKTSTFTGGAKIHDLTTYGKTHDVHKGGNRTGGFTVSGKFDDAASNTPATLFGGNEGNTFALTRRPKGTGSSLPQQVFDAVLTSYVETNPSDDYIMWSADFTISDDVDRTAQSA